MIINERNNVKLHKLPKKKDFIKYEKKFEISRRWRKVINVLNKAVKEWNTFWSKNCSDFVDKVYKIANNWKWIYDFPNTFNWVDYKPNSWIWTWLLVKKYASRDDIAKITPGSHIIVDLKKGNYYWVWKTHSIIAKGFPINWKIEAFGFPARWNLKPDIKFYDINHILRIQAI